MRSSVIVTFMKLGPYEVLDRIGGGGAGTVFRARSPDGGVVAVKVLRCRDARMVQRFDRERRLQGALGEEEGFVPLLDRGESAHGPYLVMPFLSGGTLREKLAPGPLAVDATIALARALALALGQAHARGIAHRDMKPENVLFAADGSVLVADLGLAKHFANPASPEESFSVSRTGAFSGTAGYSAPEQVRNAKSVGPQADVFALGAILHECLAGAPAFGGDSLLEVLARVSGGSCDPIVRPDVPRWLVAIIEKALSAAPQDRFADGVEMLRALEGEDWGPPLRAPDRLPFVLRRPPSPEEDDDLEVPPSTAVRTEVLDTNPTVRDAGERPFTGRPADAPQTLRIREIPFVVGEDEIPSTIRAADRTETTEVGPPAAAPRPRGCLSLVTTLLGLVR